MILPPGRRGDLTNQQWERLKPLLPAQKPKVGRPSNDHRTILNGILWILRTGAPWRDLPERYGTWETVSGRFYRSLQKWAVVKNVTEAPINLPMPTATSIGRCITSMAVKSRAHLHAAGALMGS